MYRIDRSFLGLCLGVAVLAACDDRSTPAEPSAAEAPSSASAATSDNPALVRPHEAEFHRLSREIVGYGGHFFDEQGALVVYLTDAAQATRARQLLDPMREARPLGERDVGPASHGSIVVRQANFTFPQLSAWHDRVTDEVLAREGVVFTDLDEAQNRLAIGVTGLKARMAATQVLRRLGVPMEAVRFQEVQPSDEVIPLNLRNHHRPLRGGYRLVSAENKVCTLGFNAFWSGRAAFVTTSGCTRHYKAFDGIAFYQPTVAAANLVGHEISDKGEWSDAAIIGRAAGVASDFGYIARTTSYATGSGVSGSFMVDSTNPRMRITGELSYPTVGQILDKIGGTTGWTYGTVDRTCVNLAVGGRVLRCQDWIRNMHSAAGDAGAPVFRWHGSTVVLAGTLGGGYASGGTSYTWFSAMANIRSDYPESLLTH